MIILTAKTPKLKLLNRNTSIDREKMGKNIAI